MRTHREWSQNNSCSTEVKFCNFKTIIKFPLSPPPSPSLSLMLISCKFEKQENEFEFNATVPKMNLPRISWHKLLKRNYPRDSVFKCKKQGNKEKEKHGNPTNAVNALQLNSTLKLWRLLVK